MDPVELDGIRILIVDGLMSKSKSKVVIEGVGQYDGDRFFIKAKNGKLFEIPEKYWGLVSIPITGKWKNTANWTTKRRALESHCAVEQDDIEADLIKYRAGRCFIIQ